MYEQLDERIVDAVRAGKNTFVQIQAHINTGLAFSDPAYTPGRVIDRRLQVLRRSLRLKYTGQARDKGWQIGTPPQIQQAQG